MTPAPRRCPNQRERRFSPTGIDHKKVLNILAYLTKAGRLERCGHGVYRKVAQP